MKCTWMIDPVTGYDFSPNQLRAIQHIRQISQALSGCGDASQKVTHQKSSTSFYPTSTFVDLKDDVNFLSNSYGESKKSQESESLYQKHLRPEEHYPSSHVYTNT